MATENTRIVRCPHCEEEFQARFWSVVRGDLDNDLRELIVNGEFNILMCPSCNKLFRYDDNFIYLDPIHEIIVFVMPSYNLNRSDIIEKLKEDYLSIGGEISESIKTYLHPYYFFEIDELIELIKKDELIEEETEIIEFICKENNFKTKKIYKHIAREKGLPFILPYLTTLHPHDVIDVVKEIYNKNKKLRSLRNLIEELEKLEDVIDFIEDENNPIK
mgnify:CR=1 FL=1